MSNRGMTNTLTSLSPIAATGRPDARPVAGRTRLLLEGPVLPTLLRLAAPNVLNLLAIAGMITFDGLFLGRLGPDALAGVSLAFPFVMLIQHTARAVWVVAFRPQLRALSAPVGAMLPTR